LGSANAPPGIGKFGFREGKLSEAIRQLRSALRGQSREDLTMEGRCSKLMPRLVVERLLEAMTDLELEVWDRDIIVTLPGSSYAVTYYKPKNSPQLLAKHIVSNDDQRAPMTGSEFLAKAWRLANHKARELRWIV
jgi:hypothetical protein